MVRPELNSQPHAWQPDAQPTELLVPVNKGVLVISNLPRATHLDVLKSLNQLLPELHYFCPITITTHFIFFLSFFTKNDVPENDCGDKYTLENCLGPKNVWQQCSRRWNFAWRVRVILLGERRLQTLLNDLKPHLQKEGKAGVCKERTSKQNIPNIWKVLHTPNYLCWLRCDILQSF